MPTNRKRQPRGRKGQEKHAEGLRCFFDNGQDAFYAWGDTAENEDAFYDLHYFWGRDDFEAFFKDHPELAQRSKIFWIREYERINYEHNRRDEAVDIDTNIKTSKHQKRRIQNEK